MLRLIASERQRHLEHFVGRESWIDAALGLLPSDASSPGRVACIQGAHGAGKSALCAKLSARLCRSPSREAQKVPDGHAHAKAPWLPGALLITGKARGDLRDVMACLVAQANSMLTVAVPAEALEFDTIETPWAGSARFDREPLVVRLGHLLHQVLERLVEQDGSACVILDALEESSPELGELLFLPATIPPGASVIVATSSADLSARLSRSYPQAAQLLLDEDERRGASPTDLSERAEAWEGDATRRWSLDILCVFEPCCALDLETLQRLHRHQHPDPRDRVRKSELRRSLMSVAGQLIGVDSGCIKLADHAFAEYCRQHYLGHEDVLDLVRLVTDWLASDSQNEPRVGREFLRHWGRIDLTHSARVSAAARELPDKWALNGKFESLLDAHRRLHLFDSTRELAEDCLEQAARFGNPAAMGGLGSHLLRSQSAMRGLRLLRQASQHGHAPSMAELGRRMLEGDGVALDQRAGESLLRKAVKRESTAAMTTLACHLFGRPDPGEHLLECIQLLSHASELGDVDAMTEWGRRLLDDGQTPSHPQQGLALLARAAHAGVLAAMSVLGEALLDGAYGHGEVGRGEAWLLRAAQAGDVAAYRSLGTRLLDGRGVVRDVRRGLRLLESAVESGDSEAIADLGLRACRETCGGRPNSWSVPASPVTSPPRLILPWCTSRPIRVRRSTGPWRCWPRLTVPEMCARPSSSRSRRWPRAQEHVIPRVPMR